MSHCVWLAGFLLSSCLHQNTTSLLDELPWDELTMVTATNFEPSLDVFLDDIILDDSKLARLPYVLRQQHDLARLVVSRGMQNPEVYHKGAIGRIGSAKMFVTTKARVNSANAFYGVIIRVLSEKYGCFLRGRIKSPDWYRFICKDRRQIVLWPTVGDEWMQFYARQYDAQGYEIKVVNHQIVRISDKRIL